MKRIVGAKLYHFEELGSTNDYASILIAKNKPIEGTVVMADHQVQGKGQYGRKWVAKSKLNLTLSVILYPNVWVDHQFDLNIMASIAVCDAIHQSSQIKAHVKWPNDVYVQDRKICGILIKNNIMGKSIHQSIIGIGLNVNQKEFDPLIPNPTSIINESANPVSLEDLRDVLYLSLDKYYLMLKEAPELLRQEYHNCLWRRNQMTSYMLGGLRESGIIRGIDDEGKIIIEQSEGSNAYNLSEIKLIV